MTKEKFVDELRLLAREAVRSEEEEVCWAVGVLNAVIVAVVMGDIAELCRDAVEFTERKKAVRDLAPE